MGKKNRRAGKYKKRAGNKAARSLDLFMQETNSNEFNRKRTSKSLANFIRSERYKKLNAKRDFLSVLPDEKGDLIISKPAKAISFEEAKRRDEEESRRYWEQEEV